MMINEYKLTYALEILMSIHQQGPGGTNEGVRRGVELSHGAF